MKSSKIPIELKEAVQDNNLVVFVGAGLSYNLYNRQGAKLGDWSTLVCNLIDYLEERDCDLSTLKSIFNLKQFEPIKVLEYIERDTAISHFDIISFVKTFYDLADDNDLTLHRKLFELSNKIITTNYDKAFEKASSEVDINVAYIGRDYELAALYKPRLLTLFKLHGCINDGDKMILLPKDYDTLYENGSEDAERALFYLKNLIANKHILFIGCGMGDHQINKIFSEIKQILGKYSTIKHFVLTKEKMDNKLDFLTPIYISDFSEIPNIISELIAIKNDSPINQEINRLRIQLEELERKAKINDPKFEYLDEKLNFIKDRLFSMALKAHIDNDYDNAIDLYNLILLSIGESSDIRYNLGNIYFEKKDYDMAIASYQEGLSLKPNFETFYNLGNTYLVTHNYLKAIECYKEVLMINPDFSDALCNIGKAFSCSQNYEEAIRYYEKALGFQSNLDILLEIGDAYFGLGQYDYAINYYKKAEGNYPNSIDIYAALSRVYSKIGELQKAKDYEIKVSGYGTFFPFEMSATHFMLEKQPEKSREFAEKAIQEGSLISGYIQMGNAYLAEKKEEQALEYYQQALDNTLRKAMVIDKVQASYDLLSLYGLTEDYFGGILDKLKAKI